MHVSELVKALTEASEATIRFRLPSGELTPAHAHVTEIARINKRFIDCGGTLREEALCRLQTWVADDYDHRLTAAKLAKVLKKAHTVLGDQDLDVDVEHDMGFVTQFPLASVDLIGSEAILNLQGRNTACLAPELCCPTPPPGSIVSLGSKK
jgi:hypothetical protein